MNRKLMYENEFGKMKENVFRTCRAHVEPAEFGRSVLCSWQRGKRCLTRVFAGDSNEQIFSDLGKRRDCMFFKERYGKPYLLYTTPLKGERNNG